MWPAKPRAVAYPQLRSTHVRVVCLSQWVEVVEYGDTAQLARLLLELHSLEPPLPSTGSSHARPYVQRSLLSPPNYLEPPVARIIKVRRGENGEGWLCPMSSYSHDL